MATSQDFQKHLSNGNLGEAMKLALSKMIELRISTRVVSEDGSANDRPGHQMNTRINIVDGDIENEIGSLFLKDGPYSELRSFHAQQVLEAQEIIRTNIESLQDLMSLFFQGLNRPSGQVQSVIIQEQLTEPIVKSAEDSSQGSGFADFGSRGADVGMAVSPATSPATSAATGIATGIGANVGAVTSVGFGAVEPLDSIEPMTLTEDAQEPEGFSNLIDGEGTWDEEEESDFGGEPLAALVDPSELTESQDSIRDSMGDRMGGSMGETIADPLAALSFSGSTDSAPQELADLEVADLEVADLDMAEANSLESDGDPLADAFESAFNESSDLDWENEASLSEVSEVSPEVASPDLSDTFLEEEVDPEGGTVAETAASSEVVTLEETALEETEADASLNFGDELGDDFGDDLGDDFGDDLGFESQQAADDMALLDVDTDEEPEAETVAAVESSDMALPDMALPDPSEEDAFSLLDFEEPIGDLDALDIPEGVPDPLADLSFAPFSEAIDSEESFDFMADAELPEVEGGLDTVDTVDPADWNAAAELGGETVIEYGASETVEPALTDTGETSEDWNFESSPDFSLEGTEDVSLPDISLPDVSLDTEAGGSFDQLSGLEDEPEDEPFNELANPFGADLGNDFGVDNDFGVEFDAFGDSEDFSEPQDLRGIASLESPDGLDFDRPVSDRDLEESFASSFEGDSFEGESLEDLASIAESAEPQTFEEWEGLSSAPSLEDDLPGLEVAVGMEDLADLQDLHDLDHDLDSVENLDDLDSSDWDFETPSIGSDLNSPNENWDDADDFDDMALLPEELDTSQPLSFDKEEPLVGDAMGLADVDAMDSLFQNSANDFDLSSPSGSSELDPFLDLDDPFDDVEDSESDPFGALDLDDAPIFPPPPPRPKR